MVVVADGLADYIERDGGGGIVVLRNVEDAAGLRAMAAAREALLAMRHPEAPDESLPNYVSDVVIGPSGATFEFDIPDLDAYELAKEVVRVIAGAIDAEGVGGTLGWPERDEPDRRAPDHVLARFGPGSLPAGTPADLPLPEGIVNAGERSDNRFVIFMHCPDSLDDLMGFFERAAVANGYTLVLSLEVGPAERRVRGHVVFERGAFGVEVTIVDHGPESSERLGSNQRVVNICGYDGTPKPGSLIGGLRAGRELPAGDHLHIRFQR